MPNATGILDFSPFAKLRFVATALPILGAVGGVLRANGQSDEVVLMVVIPLLFVGFYGWRFAAALKIVRQATGNKEREFWAEHDARAARGLREQIEAQREELQRLRVRQQAEQDRILRQNPSPEQLARMMERHRSEYEDLFNRRTASQETSGNH
ncbi:MAG TPA: hypothetical protein VGA56_18120 [Opitutaceae bacterium]